MLCIFFVIVQDGDKLLVTLKTFTEKCMSVAVLRNTVGYDTSEEVDWCCGGNKAVDILC